MAFLNTIIEFEGPVVEVRARWWAAHQEAIAATGFQGPSAEEFWRLVRTGATDAAIIRFGKHRHAEDYARIRDERRDSLDLMALDELQPDAAVNLRVLQQLGNAVCLSLKPLNMRCSMV